MRATYAGSEGARTGNHTVVENRQLPLDLVAALRRARELERLAAGRDQWVHATRATARLAQAAVAVGWRIVEVAADLELPAGTLSARIRGLPDADDTGLVVTPPPPPAGHVAPPLPVDQREWLTYGEAAQVAGVSLGTVSQWHRAGLLPSTITGAKGRFLYSRTDLERIRSAPRRGTVGVDRPSVVKALRAQNRRRGSRRAG